MRQGTVKIVHATAPEQIAAARELFLEYAESLGFSLCFQNFDRELAELPGDYAPPRGRLLLLETDGGTAGCVAMRDLGDGICEMKRLYIRPAFRGRGFGRRLANEIIGQARDVGYQRMRLDTVAGKMDEAIAMYRALGFYEIAPYRNLPVEGAKYMELLLE